MSMAESFDRPRQVIARASQINLECNRRLLAVSIPGLDCKLALHALPAPRRDRTTTAEVLAAEWTTERHELAKNKHAPVAPVAQNPTNRAPLCRVQQRIQISLIPYQQDLTFSPPGLRNKQ